MRTRSGNLLLIELVIVALFLSLSATVILRLYAAAYDSSRDSHALIEATLISQNTLERMLNAPDMSIYLASDGFALEDGDYVKRDGAVVTRVSLTDAVLSTGRIESGSISVLQGDDTLITLPVSRYIPEVNGYE